MNLNTSTNPRTMNLSTSTNEQATTALLGTPRPPFTVAVEWRDLVEWHQALLEKLVRHPAMAPNLQQTFRTPAASKNNVYFMWDYVGRTLGMLYHVNPRLENLSANQKAYWNDLCDRAEHAGMLITNKLKGTLDTMTESAYPGQHGQHQEFGEEILKLAGEMCGGYEKEETNGKKKRKKRKTEVENLLGF